MTKLSIIIVNWNTREILRKCLASIRKHLSSNSPEVFVVDNASTDGSTDMIKKEFPWVRLIENRKNVGFARANNMAIHRASGEFIFLLNSDTIVKRGAIHGLLQTMKEDKSIGIAGLQLLNANGTYQNSVSNFPTLITELTNKSLLKTLFPGKFYGKRSLQTSPFEVETVIGACMMIRGKAIEEIGLFDEAYFFFMEETDLCYRMKKAGWKVVHDPRHSIIHLQGKTAEKINDRARIEYWRSRYTYFEKHHGAKILLILKMGLIVRLLMSMGLLTLGVFITAFRNQKLNNRLKTYSKILIWHIKGCPAENGLEFA